MVFLESFSISQAFQVKLKTSPCWALGHVMRGALWLVVQVRGWAKAHLWLLWTLLTTNTSHITLSQRQPISIKKWELTPSNTKLFVFLINFKWTRLKGQQGNDHINCDHFSKFILKINIQWPCVVCVTFCVHSYRNLTTDVDLHNYVTTRDRTVAPLPHNPSAHCLPFLIPGNYQSPYFVFCKILYKWNQKYVSFWD